MSDIKPQITLGRYSTQPGNPDYACPAYIEMVNRWQVADDVREGTDAIRSKRSDYLPKFNAEEEDEYKTRVQMTYQTDSYDLTLEEHVGLITSESLKLTADVPTEIAAIVEEDVNGEGDGLDAFRQDVLDSAMHWGHCAILTDMPDTSGIETLAQQRAARIRPYAVLYDAPDILNWATVSVGGVRCLVQVTLRELTDRDPEPGEHGAQEAVRFRQITQEVIRNADGAAVRLGAITWRSWEIVEKDGAEEFVEAGSGPIRGVDKIPLRIVYGGRKKGILRSVPHLKGVAYTTLEHVALTSDLAIVMHKCNVPTPVFIGRQQTEKGEDVRMGQGVDLPINGDAKMLEPSGVAIEATMSRLEMLERRMQRQGATTSDGSGKVLTATEAAMVARSRNAKLRKAAESADQAFEGMLSDFASFMNLESGGSIETSTNFAGAVIDPDYLRVLLEARKANEIGIEELRFALQHGRLPDEFSEEDALLKLLAELDDDSEGSGEPVGGEGEGDDE